MVADAQRKRELGAIHVAKKQLALTDESYADLLERLTGQRSAKELDAKQRSRVIEEFRRLGWGRGGNTAPSPGSPHAPRRRVGSPPSPAPGSCRGGEGKQLRKIRALWLSLHHLAEVDDPSETALEHFATTLTKKDRMAWSDASALVWVTEALLDWCQRKGYDARSPLQAWAPAPETWDSRLIEAQWRRLIALGAFEHGIHAGLDTWLKRTVPTSVSAPHFLPPDQQRRAVQLLGAWLRRVKASSPRRGPPPANPACGGTQ